MAAAIPFVVVGIPVMVFDATNVAREHLWKTLAPQVFGFGLGAASWALCAIGTLARKK